MKRFVVAQAAKAALHVGVGRLLKVLGPGYSALASLDQRIENDVIPGSRDSCPPKLLYSVLVSNEYHGYQGG
jgi:hypothetical protein